MDIISISSKKFASLTPLKLSKEIFNTEGNIYEFEYRGKPEILKYLHHLSGPIFASKLYTVEMLDSNSEYLPESFYCPDHLFSIGSTISGFTVPWAKGVNLSTFLSDRHADLKEQVYYLKKVGELLQQLKTIRKYTPLKTLFINDLHESNFIVNPDNKHLYVIDLDSCKIGSNLSFPARYLTPFSLLNEVHGKYNINDDSSVPGYVMADENSDLYCYNIMILNYLYGKSVNSMNGSEFYEYLNYLNKIGINGDLLNSFSAIIVNKDNENPVNYLDSLTTEQIYRAKSIVYKKTKNS